jgi:predicted RNA-binding protein with PIN domain
MAEHILIDGYNVIHSLPDLKKTLTFRGTAASHIFTQEASRFLVSIDRVTVVFDGNDAISSIEYQGNSKRFCVIYSGEDTTADTIIEQLVRKGKHKLDYTVVTNDHGLSNTIRSIGGVINTSTELIDMIGNSGSRYALRM